MRSIRTLKLVTANHIDYRYKSTDRSELNRLTAQKGNCDDIVIVKNGFITDTSFTNLALFDGHQWLTPAHPLLAGTQRALLLEQGKIKVTMFANANAMTTVGRRSLEALRLQPLGKPPQCFS